MTKQTLETRVKVLLWFFIIALLLSGITAFPLEWELSRLNQIVNGAGSPLPVLWPEMTAWIAWVNTGIQDTAHQYPFIAYGTDWLAFAHIVIAIAFWGPLRDPVRNLWVIEWGMIACVLVIPLALIFGPIRGIPFFHRLIDCSFGVVGIIPLWLCWKTIRHIKKAQPAIHLALNHA
jgi:hypothetical protein